LILLEIAFKDSTFAREERCPKTALARLLTQLILVKKYIDPCIISMKRLKEKKGSAPELAAESILLFRRQ